MSEVTTMHPAKCAACGKRLLHTCDPHVKCCTACIRRLGGVR